MFAHITEWLARTVEWQDYQENGVTFLVGFTILTLILTPTIQLWGTLAQAQKVYDLKQSIKALDTSFFIFLATYFCVFLAYGIRTRSVGSAFNAAVITPFVIMMPPELWRRRGFTPKEWCLGGAGILTIVLALTTPYIVALYMITAVATFTGPVMQIRKMKREGSAGVSRAMYIAYAGVTVVWIFYGIFMRDPFIFVVCVAFASAYSYIAYLVGKHPVPQPKPARA